MKKPKISTDDIETASTSVANNPDSSLFFRSLTIRVCYSLFLIASWCRADCVYDLFLSNQSRNRLALYKSVSKV